MPGLAQFAGTWWLWIVHASWQLGLLVVVMSVVTTLLRSRSAHLLHALWLLVLVKAFLPPYVIVSAEWANRFRPLVLSPPLLRSAALDPVNVDQQRDVAVGANVGFSDSSLEAAAGMPPLALLLLTCWAIGGFVFWLLILGRYWRLSQSINSTETLDEGPLCIALEKAALGLGISRCPELRLSRHWTSPFLVGITHPKIVIPESLVREASEPDLLAVLAHELVHYRRRDIWIGWLQTLGLSLFWFHPLVWWAMFQLRQTREEACDETVLQQTSIAPEDYGNAMLRLVTKAQVNSQDGIGLIGVFERRTQIQTRLERIMTFKRDQRVFGFGSKWVVALASVLMLPMALLPTSDAQERATSQAQADTLPATPQIVSTEPAIGATDVKLSTTEIKVTFDRDMRGGMSWTGGPPHFPPTNKQARAGWIDKRTCVLPVVLQRGKFYLVGINSTSYQNFRSTAGIAADPSAIYFTTQDAAPQVVALAKRPTIKRLEPSNHATDVEPSLKMLTVTFDMPMGEGMSWTGSGPEFPATPDGKRATWSADKRTCTLPVKLEPGKTYRLGLNSQRHINFKNVGGVPLEPVEYTFQTK